MKQLLFVCIFGCLLSVFTATTAFAESCGVHMCTIVGTSGANTIHGTSGPDVICGLGGNDVIYAKGGNDVVCGGPGDDVIYGEGGNDILLGEADQDTIDGGTGTDRGHWTGASGVWVNLTVGCSSEDGPNTVLNIEDLWGGGGDNVFIGNAANNELIGFGGDDILDGNGGTDRCDGLTGSEDTCADCETENGCELEDYATLGYPCGVPQ